MRPLLLLVLVLCGCDLFLADNPRNCEKSPAVCGEQQRCNLVRKTCVAAPPAPLRRASRSSTIALSEDDRVVAMTSPEDGSLALFDASTGARRAVVKTGGGPAAVVLHPDGKTAFVANRDDATVVKIADLAAAAPQIVATLSVGAEPTGLALSPNGDRLFVAEFAQGRVSAIDTETMTVTAQAGQVTAVRALLVTNDGDKDDEDELVVAPEFFGVQKAEGAGRDDGLSGVVHLLRSRDLAPAGQIGLAPHSAGSVASPNQLGAVAFDSGRLYLTATGVSPAPPLDPPSTVQPLVHVIDLASQAEVQGPLGTTNLGALLLQAPGDPAGRRLLADLSDFDFVPGRAGVGYSVSRGSDTIQRVFFDAATSTTSVGSTMNLQILLSQGCEGPTGIVVQSKERAFVNCWLGRSLGILDLAEQRLVSTSAAAPLPSGGSQEDREHRGRLAFHSALSRWSRQGRVSCASCHPDGLSDNVTWIMPDGPRQTPSLGSAFSHGPGTQVQRAFGWSATVDEVHDFESYVRSIAGGLGALTESNCGDLAKEMQRPLPREALLSPAATELQAGACTNDWDHIEAYLRRLRPPLGRRDLDRGAVSRGAGLFVSGGCARCHGGPLWSVGRRFYTPSAAVLDQLRTEPFRRPAAWPQSYTTHGTFQIAAQPGPPEVAPLQMACLIRNVATFGAAALERKVDGTTAQGQGGYSPPSLYGLSLSAPYLHHGQARTLEALFSDSAFMTHTQAGNANFLADGSSQERADLISYLRSIDATTAEVAIPAGFDEGCSAR